MEGRGSWRFYQAGYGCVLRLEERCYLGAQSAGLLLSRDSEMRQDGTGSGLWTSKGGDKHW